MGVCSATSKCVLLVINLLFWVAAAFMLYAGISYLQSSEGILNDVHNKPAMVTFSIAALLFLCGLIGIAGAFSEKKVLLGIFTFVIVATFALLMYVSIVLFTQRDNAMNQTDTFVHKQFDNYNSPNLTELHYDNVNYSYAVNAYSSTTAPSSTAGPATTTPGNSTSSLTTSPLQSSTAGPTTATPGNSTANFTSSPAPTNVSTATTPMVVTTTAAPQGKTNSTVFVDDIQKNLQCCGYENYTDYMNLEYWGYHHKVPNSCCNKTALVGNATCPELLGMKQDIKLIYNKPCKHEVDTIVNFVYDFMRYTAVAFCVLVFLGFCATVFLMHRKRRDGFNYESIVA